MRIIVAPVMFHERVDTAPEEMLLGAAVKELITGAVPSVDLVTVTVTFSVTVPKLLTAANP